MADNDTTRGELSEDALALVAEDATLIPQPPGEPALSLSLEVYARIADELLPPPEFVPMTAEEIIAELDDIDFGDAD